MRSFLLGKDEGVMTMRHLLLALALLLPTGLSAQTVQIDSTVVTQDWRIALYVTVINPVDTVLIVIPAPPPDTVEVPCNCDTIQPPPPDTVPTPPPTPEGMAFASTFEQTGIISDLQNGFGMLGAGTDHWGGGTAPYNVTITADEPFLGDAYSALVRMGNTGGEWRFSLPGVGEVWWEFYWYLPDGSEAWSNGIAWNPDFGIGNAKWFRLWDDVAPSSYGATPLNGKMGSRHVSQAGIGTSQAFLRMTTYGGSVQRTQAPSIADFTTEGDRGRWVQWRVHLKQGANEDAEMHAWKGDDLTPFNTWTGFTLHSASGTWSMGYFNGSENYINYPSELMTAVSRIKFWATDPGWSYN